MRPNFNRASATITSLLPSQRPDKTVVDLAAQGGAALTSYTAGGYQGALRTPGVTIGESSTTSGSAVNLLVANGIDPVRSDKDVTEIWRYFGTVGSLSSLFPEPLREMGAPAALHNLGYTLDVILARMKRGDIHMMMNTVTEIRQGQGLHPGNIRHHVHQGKDLTRHHALASAALENMWGYPLNGKRHWDGVYSGENPALDPFRVKTDVPLILMAVDHKDIVHNPDYPNIVYGSIYDQWKKFAAEDWRPTYMMSLDRTQPGLESEKIRRLPRLPMVEKLREMGIRDMQTVLKQVKEDRAQGLHDRYALEAATPGAHAA